MCGEGEKKGFFARLFAKMDKKIKEKADQSCCCSSQPEAPADDRPEEKQGCC